MGISTCLDERTVTRTELIRGGELLRYYPEKDIGILIEIYNKADKGRLKEEAEEFLLKVGIEMFLDSCYEGRASFFSSDYRRVYSEYIIEETHHELVRKRYRWDEDNRRFIGLNDKEYEEARLEIIYGFVEAGIWFLRNQGKSKGLKFKRSLEFFAREKAN